MTFHDSGGMAWTIVAGYAVAAMFATIVALRLREQFWTIMAMASLFLGINKQLDLQTGLTVLLRRLAQFGGWYAVRRIAQYGFVAALVVVAAIGAVLAWRRLKGADASRRIAATGLALLATYVLLRVAAIHHVLGDDVSGQGLLGVELAGVAMVGFGAAIRLASGNNPT